MIIVSIGIYLNLMYSSQAEEYNETIAMVELEKFNSKFNVYLGRVDIKAQEIVSIATLAKEYNYQVRIFVGSTEIKLYSNAETTPENFIKEYQDKTFSCIPKTTGTNINPVYDSNGKIITLRFKVNS